MTDSPRYSTIYHRRDAMPTQRTQGGKASAQPHHGKVSAAEIEKFVGGIDFPCDKKDLINHAQEKGAPREVLDLMGKFPDKEYGSAIDVSKGVGEVKH
jgi:hypothetical protein